MLTDEGMQNANSIVFEHTDGTTEYFFFTAHNTVEMFEADFPVLYDIAKRFGTRNENNPGVTVRSDRFCGMEAFRGAQELREHIGHFLNLQDMTLFVLHNRDFDMDRAMRVMRCVGHPEARVCSDWWTGLRAELDR